MTTTRQKATKARAIASAKRAGLTLTITKGGAELDPPPGKVLAGHMHYQCYYYENEEGYRWGDIWESIINNCESGTEAIDPECEDCR